MKYTKGDDLDILLTMASAQAAKKLADDMKSEDASDVVFDEYYYKKRKRIIMRESQRSFLNVAKKYLFKAAAFVLAAMSAGYLVVMSTDSTRGTEGSIVLDWHDKSAIVRYVPSDKTRSKAEADANNAKESYMPTWIPDGVDEVIDKQSGSRVDVSYYKDNVKIAEYTQGTYMHTVMSIDNEHSVITMTTVNGHEAVLSESEFFNLTILIWVDGDYIHKLSSSVLDVDTLFQMAISVK